MWPGQGFETEAIYDLRSNTLTPTVRDARSTTWQQIARGDRPMQIIVGPSLLRHA